jgi:transposase
MTWLHDHVHFEQSALQATLADHVYEAHHAGERIAGLEKAIGEAIAHAPEEIRSVIAALQVLRGAAQMTAVTLVVETGSLSRFRILVN